MSQTTQAHKRQDIEAILASQVPASDWLGRRNVRVGIALLAILGALLVVWSLTRPQSAVSYGTDTATRGTLVVVVTATGSVQPTNKVDVSSELSGTVRRVLVDYNSHVTAGQTLAELDTDKLKATVASARAKLAAAHARVADAEATLIEKQRELERKQILSKRQVASMHDLDSAKAASDRAVAGVASARADVSVAEADLALNETNLAKACICSPISGVVLKRSVDPGQTVASSLQAPVLFSIAEDLKQMELQVDVDEADVGKVRVGQTATFGVDAFPDRKFPAMIRDVRFAPETIQGVVTYKAVLTIDNTEMLLRPGMTATAEINVTEVRDALLVANAALRFAPAAGEKTESRSVLGRILPGPPPFRAASQRESTGSSRVVWTLTEGQATAVKVVIGPSDGRRTQIISGEIKEGQPLIVDQVARK